MIGAWHGTRQEVSARAGREPTATDRSCCEKWENDSSDVQRSGDRGANVLPLAQGVWRLAGGLGEAAWAANEHRPPDGPGQRTSWRKYWSPCVSKSSLLPSVDCWLPV